jgi:hypothetical protein
MFDEVLGVLLIANEADAVDGDSDLFGRLESNWQCCQLCDDTLGSGVCNL